MAILQQIKVPLISVNDTSLTVVDILFKQGNAVKKGATIIVFETSKTTYDVLAEEDGYIEYLCEKEQDYQVGDVVANIYTDLVELPVPQNTPQHVTLNINGQIKHDIPAIAWQGETWFSNKALQLIELHGIARSAFAGKDFVSGEEVNFLLGITKKDTTENAPVIATKKSVPVTAIDVEKVTIEKLSSNKKMEINYLEAVQTAGLTSTINTWIDTEGIFVHLNQSLQILKNSLLPVILFEAARLLKEYKVLNAFYTDGSIAYYKAVNIGFAIDINKGLKVLKIANTNTIAIGEIETEILNLSDKYLDDKLQLNDLTDISFTVTDLSGEGVAFFKPLINAMNSAILGISAIDDKLHRCMLSLTFDHRVTEGKIAAQFLKDLSVNVSAYQSKYHPGLNQDISCFKCFKLLKHDISTVGFAKCITPKGEEAYICQSCLKGF